jgi:hypothetical protein
VTDEEIRQATPEDAIAQLLREGEDEEIARLRVLVVQTGEGDVRTVSTRTTIPEQ